MNSKFFTLQSFTPRTVFKFLDRSTLYSQQGCLPLNHSHQSLTLTSNPHSKMNPRNSFRNAMHKKTSADADKYIVMLHYYYYCFFQVQDQAPALYQTLYQHANQHLAVCPTMGVPSVRGVVCSGTAPRHVSRLIHPRRLRFRPTRWHRK